MSDKKHFRWLLNELPRLRQEGVISAETETGLHDYYAAKITDSRNYFPLALAIFGMLLIAGGIVLLFNHNWDMLSVEQQTAVSFLPLALGATISFITLCGGKSQLWREASAILTAAGGAVAVALLSHIYQVNGSLSDYMTLVLLTSLPLIFIFDSAGLAAIYAFGMFPLIESGAATNWLRLPILGGIAVWLIWHLRKQDSWRVYARYLTVVVLVYTSIQYGRGCPALMLFTLAGVFLLLGCELADEGETFWRNPWFPVSFLLLTVMLAIGSESDRLLRFHVRSPLVNFWIVESLFLIGLAWIIVRHFMKKKLDVFRIMIPVLMVAVLLCSGFRSMPGTGFVCRIFMNCFMGALGIALLCEGSRTRSMLVFNEGMLVCGVLFAVRFLSSDLSLIARGIGMILAGLLVIGANLYLSHRIRKEKEVCHETK